MNQNERIQSLIDWAKRRSENNLEAIENLEFLRSTGLGTPSSIDDINLAIKILNRLNLMNPNYTTPGPWSSDSEFISSPDGFVAQLVERDTPRETEANARLIASAPDLLEIIRALLPHASNEWERLDDLVHRGSRESENAARELDNLIDRANEILAQTGGAK